MVERVDSEIADAFEAALRALRHRDLSTEEVRERLLRRGLPEDEIENAVARLRETGLVEDARFAQARARTLAARGGGNELIRVDLERRGLDAVEIEEALAVLPPEEERAREVVRRRGPGARTARYLSAKGFAADLVASVVAEAEGDALR